MNLGIGIITGLVTMASWGGADFFAAFASRRVGHFITLFWAYVVAFFVTLVYLLFSPQSLNLSPEMVVMLALVGLLQALALMFFYKGLEIGLVSIVSPIASSYSLIVVLLGIILLKEQLTTLQGLAILLIILGVPLVSINLHELFKNKAHIFQKGIKEALVSLFAWGFSYFLLTPVVRENGWFWPTLLDIFFIVLFLFIWGLLAKEKFLVLQKLSFLAIFSDGFLTSVGYLAYSIGLLYSLVSLVTPISTIFPVVTILLARVFFKEKLLWNQILGIAGVIGGLVILSV